MKIFPRLSDHDPIFRRKDFYNLVRAGKVPGYSIVQKFGNNLAVGTTLVPVTAGGLYQTPTTGQSIEVVSDNAADTALGAGGRNCIVYGLDGLFMPAVAEVALAGIVPVAVPGVWTRVYRLECTASGSYASQILSSHLGTLSVNTTPAGVLWGQVGVEGTFGLGNSLIGMYSVGAGCTAFLLSKFISVDTGQDVKVFLFHRPGINIVAAPFSGMRLQQVESGIDNAYNYVPHLPMAVYNEYTDMGFMAKAAGGPAEVSADFELMIIENDYL